MTELKTFSDETSYSNNDSPTLFQNKIEKKLQDMFEPLILNVTNDSHKHAGHAAAGAATHFSIDIVSDAFNNLSRVARHRLVYSALSEAFDNGLHALNITALAPNEKT